MGEVRAKVFEFAVEVNEAGDATIPGGEALPLPAGWTADHLLLMALVRCSIESLRYSARRGQCMKPEPGKSLVTLSKAIPGWTLPL